MIKPIGVLELAAAVEKDSQSGKLSEQLLQSGNTLYGRNDSFPGYIERISPDNKRVLGYWNDGVFVEIFCLIDLKSY
tara:strand:+ start:13274 stop:13504 length:231 start_codon:yes stop_codon:yes gene_type:complete